MVGTPRKLRAWQTEALKKFLAHKGKDFLAVATPGAGKTTFALTAAAKLLQDRLVEQIVVVAPTEHLKHQWADAAASFGIPLDPTWTNNSKLAPGYLGVVVTYAQVAADPVRHQGGVAARGTFVVLDEVHHAGDSLSWGDAVKTAYGAAVRRLSLSGSPWRSDANPIPFVGYVPEADGGKRSAADYTYGYSQALQDGVVRPVMFMAYSGTSRWRTGSGGDLSASLDGPADKVTTNRAWRAALDPKEEWITEVLTAADARLTQVRAAGMADAGGLVLASNQTHAKKYAKQLEAICGEAVTIVVSEETGASKRIEDFAAGVSRWLVAVRMVSEGVDVPRLAVGVYATNSATALFFTQAIGRFVRARGKGEIATVFIPSVPSLQRLAAELELERDHVLGGIKGDAEEALMMAANRSEKALDSEEFIFESLGATAHLDRVIYGGDEFGPSVDNREDAEDGFLNMSGVLSPSEVAAILADRAYQRTGSDDASDDETIPLHRRVKAARQELAREVAIHAAATGESHAQVHTWLRQVCGGPPVGEATLEDIHVRVKRLRFGEPAKELVQVTKVADDAPWTLWDTLT